MEKSGKNETKKAAMLINTTKTLEQLVPLVEDCAKSLGLIVLETSLKKEKARCILQIFIYNPEKPVDHADCAGLSSMVGNKIEENTLIDVPYALEVSSPGINRKLKNPVEYEVFKHKQVKAVLKEALSGDVKGNVLSGELLGLSEDHTTVSLIIKGKEVSLQIENIKTIQLEG